MHADRRCALPLVAMLAVVAVVVSACGSTGPSATPGPNGATGVAITASDAGIGVSIALSKASVRGGETIGIVVAATNIGLDEATYESGGCGPTSNIIVTGPPITEPPFNLNEAPVDTDGAPILALARWSALAMSGPQLDSIRQPDWPDGAMFGCPANLAFDTLPPAGHLEATWQWTARDGYRVPAAPGQYTVRYVFPLVGRGAVAFKDDGTPAVRHDVVVEAPLTVTAADGASPTLTADDAIMAAIADPEVKAWANRALTRETMEGASITFVDGVWRWQIDHPGGHATIDVDATNGTVLAKHL